jgi:hypothetical protein
MHDHHVALGVGEVLLGRPVDIARAKRAADADLRPATAHEIVQPAFARIS